MRLYTNTLMGVTFCPIDYTQLKEECTLETVIYNTAKYTNEAVMVSSFMCMVIF